MCLWGKSAQQWILSRVVELEEKGRWWAEEGELDNAASFPLLWRWGAKRAGSVLMQFICFKANWPALKMPRLYYDLLSSWGQSLKFWDFWRENSNDFKAKILKLQMHQFFLFGAKIQMGTRNFWSWFFWRENSKVSTWLAPLAQASKCHLEVN